MFRRTFHDAQVRNKVKICDTNFWRRVPNFHRLAIFENIGRAVFQLCVKRVLCYFIEAIPLCVSTIIIFIHVIHNNQYLHK